jgi:metallo-beta-lactamase family protein
LYVIRTGGHTVLLECGLIQGGDQNEERNREPFPVDIDKIDAVVLSHAHIDHSGRIPRLVRQGYDGPVFAHEATMALCEIMLPDSGYLNEKEAEWENKKRRRNGKSLIQPLYTLEDGERCIEMFRPVPYGDTVEVVPGLELTYHDAGHILGSSIVELSAGGRTLVFSGDLGFRDAPVMNAAKPDSCLHGGAHPGSPAPDGRKLRSLESRGLAHLPRQPYGHRGDRGLLAIQAAVRHEAVW